MWPPVAPIRICWLLQIILNKSRTQPADLGARRLQLQSFSRGAQSKLTDTTCTSKSDRRICRRNVCSPTGEVRQSSIKEIFTEAEVSSRALTKRGTWLSRQRLKETVYSHNELNLYGRRFSHW